MKIEDKKVYHTDRAIVKFSSIIAFIAAGATSSPTPAPTPPVNVPALDEWGRVALAALLSGTAIRRMKKRQPKA
jgi:hypothetical protein